MTTHSPSRTLTVAIATPIDPELVKPIRAVGDNVEVLYQPDLLPPVRYPGDHQGVEGFSRDPDAERRWQELLGSAEVLFGLPGDSPPGLAAVVRSNPGLRWVQGTAAGTGEQVKAAGLSEDELERVVITSASSVHVGPLAEFCMMGLIHFTKGVPRLQDDQRAHHRDHYPVHPDFAKCSCATAPTATKTPMTAICAPRSSWARSTNFRRRVSSRTSGRSRA